MAMLFGCGHAVLLLPFRQPIVQGYMQSVLRLFDRLLSCSALLRGRRRGLPGLRRTPALMARLAMWKAGGYLLPLPTLRLRARLESGGIDVYGAASRAAAVRTFHQL